MKKYKKIYIEITNICNLDCDFCTKTARIARFMDRELLERILEQVKGYTRFLYFHVMGEPLLHPDLGLFLDLCRTHGYQVNITTNGTLIRKVKDTLLAKPALRQVNFSLHSFEANEARGSIDRYLDGIFSFIEQSREQGRLLISLRLWNLAEGQKSENNAYILERIEEAFSLSYRIAEKLTPCRGIKLAENIFLHQAHRFRWPSMKEENFEGRGFCYGLRDQAAILVDGTVVPCCLDGEGIIRLGNIREQSFDEIVGSPRAMALYDGFSNRQVVETLCRKCGYRTRFS